MEALVNLQRDGDQAKVYQVRQVRAADGAVHSLGETREAMARKGVFLTTGVFSAEAADYVSRTDPRVVLIDGRQLAEYMLDLNLGVTPRAAYELKRIDSDYFAED